MGNRFLKLSDEVREALQSGKPLVALESTIISHGMPYPQNLETARKIENEIRINGAIPATIALIDGYLKVGLSDTDLKKFAEQSHRVVKCSTRDLGVVIAQRKMGSTTVAATMFIAHYVGIRFFATGGIGGVHREAQHTMDISADLQELAKTSVAVVTAGPKAILDIGLTMEYLETHRVPIFGFRTDSMPAFYTNSSQYPLEYRFDEISHLVQAIYCHWACGLQTGIVIANPIPSSHELDRDVVEAIIQSGLLSATQRGIKGKAVTPFLLQYLYENTGGHSLEANIALVLNNAALAAKIAVEWGKTIEE